MIGRDEFEELCSSDVYLEGEAQQKRGDVWEFAVQGDTLFDDISAVVKGPEHIFYEVAISVNRSYDYIAYHECDCPDGEEGGEFCAHCVAVALEYNQFCRQRAEKGSVGRALRITQEAAPRTTPAIKDLLVKKGIRQTLSYTQKDKWGRVRLEPFLTIDLEHAEAEFKVGVSAMYIVKDVAAFVERIEAGQQYSYGKRLAFTHAPEMFEPRSLPLVKFLRKYVQEQRNSMSWPAYSYGLPRCREIALDGNSLESLLDLMDGQEIFCNVHGQKSGYYHVSQEPFSCQLTVRRENGGAWVELERSIGIPCRSCYVFFWDGCIYRTPIEQYEPVEDFFACVRNARSGRVFLAEEDISSFCQNVLPELREAFECQFVDFRPEDYSPRQAQCRVYLDLEGQELITIKAVACYEDGEYLIFDDKTDMDKRDMKGETRVRQVVDRYSNAFDYQRRIMVLSQDEELLYELLTEGMERLKEVSEVYVSDAFQKLKVQNAPRVAVGVSMSGDMLNLKLISQEMPREQLIEILSRYNRKKKYYRLKNGDFIHMADGSLPKLAELTESLQLTERQLRQEFVELPKYRALYLDAQMKEDHALQASRDANFRNLIKNMKSIEDNEFEVPEGMEQILREYQKVGFRWIKTLCHNGFGGILADDMGLGKTLQAIAFLLSEYQDPSRRSYALIITPASLVYNWGIEFERFAPQLPVRLVVGAAPEREAILNDATEPCILITSYDLLKRDIKWYQGRRFGYQIIDEAQYIKNYATQNTRAVKEVAAGFRLALTGTPIENRLSELWSIFDYLMPGFLYTSHRFREEFEGRIVREKDDSALARLQKMTSPFILRRLKGDVLKDLPDKIEENRYVPLHGEQQKLYDAHVKRLQMVLEKNTDAEFLSSKIQILSELTKIRQICCDPSLLFEGYQGESAKLSLCVQMVQNAVENGHKALVFSQFATMLERIQERLAQEGIRFYSLTGKDSKERRKEMVEAFQSDQTPVFCISLKAGGIGLNLTAADIVIHYDPWWNVAAQNQATDRAHRIGQTNTVNVYKLIAKGTIEEKIVALQERKRELAEQILGGSSDGTASFSREELLELLRQ